MKGALELISILSSAPFISERSKYILQSVERILQKTLIVRFAFFCTARCDAALRRRGCYSEGGVDAPYKAANFRIPQ